MPKMWGREMSRDAFLGHLGSLEQVAEARLVTVDSGAERGSRTIQMRSPGLSYEILLDRGFDIGRCDVAGTGVAFRNSVGFPAPGPAPAAQKDSLRLWGGGLLMTGGLDHVFGPETKDATHFGYPSRPTQEHPAHGRIWLTAAKLVALGTEWRDAELVVFAEAEVRQTSAFGENLTLRRRIESIAGRLSISVRDVVRNEGHATTPHMLLYHVNVGAPLAWPGSHVRVPDVPVVSLGAVDASEHTTLPEASHDEAERVFLLNPPAGETEASVQDPISGSSMTIRYDSTALPHLLVWQSIARGGYGVGLEPATNKPIGPDGRRADGEIVELRPGQEKEYALDIDFSLADPVTPIRSRS